tara:strand:+ start:131 stop:319 length:189 start_codon:yes stop_codon:yes gene_type:complete
MAKSRFNKKYNISVRKRSNDDAKSTAEFIEAADHVKKGHDLSTATPMLKHGFENRFRKDSDS